MQVLSVTFGKWVEMFSLKEKSFQLDTIFHVHNFLGTSVNATPIKIQSHRGRFLAGKATSAVLPLPLPPPFSISQNPAIAQALAALPFMAVMKYVLKKHKMRMYYQK